MTRKYYFLGNERHRRPQSFYIRPKIVAKYRGALAGYRTLRVFKQIFEAMDMARENDEWLTKGEFVAILREDLNTDNPSSAELNHFNTEVFKFRRFLGAVAGILMYVKHEYVEQIKGMEWIYRPLQSKREYKPVEKHMQIVINGLTERMAANRQLLEMTPRQIEKRLQEFRDELELEAKGHTNP